MPVPTEKLVQNTITVPVEEYAVGDVLVDAPDTPFALSLSLLVPIAALSHSVPGQFPLIIGLQNPAVDLALDVTPATQALTLTLNAPSLIIDSNEDAAGPQTLTLTLLAPSIIADANILLQQILLPFSLTLSGPNQLSPGIGYLGVTIKKYISDPIKTGGCAQCGTFLYESVRGRQVRGEVVKRGRNFDLDKGRREDRYVRCGRCGWINHLDRAVHHQPDSSRAGWGLKYEEFEIVPNEPFE